MNANAKRAVMHILAVYGGMLACTLIGTNAGARWGLPLYFAAAAITGMVTSRIVDAMIGDLEKDAFAWRSKFNSEREYVQNLMRENAELYARLKTCREDCDRWHKIAEDRAGEIVRLGGGEYEQDKT